VVQLVGDPLHHALECGKVEDEPALRLEASLDHGAGPVVVAVQGFAPVASERDEVSRGEDEVYSGGAVSPVAARQTSSASHSNRCWA